MVRLRACALACALFVIFLSGRVSAQTIEWTNDGSKVWSDTGNWSSTPLFDGTDNLGFNLSGFSSQVTSTVDNFSYLGTLSINSLGISGSVTGGMVLNSSYAGILNISDQLTDSSPSPVTITVAIGGAASVNNDGGGMLTLSGNSSYTGGTTIASGTLVIGASSVPGYYFGTFTGPLGTGTLTLAAGTGLTTIDSNAYEIFNNISLNGTGTVTLLGGSSGGNIGLTGTITGNAGLEIAASGNASPNTVALSSSSSTFRGGVTVETGETVSTTLDVAGSTSGGSGASVTSGPLGTGTLTVERGSNLTFSGDPDAYSSGPTTIGNNIDLADAGTVTLNAIADGGVILSGAISGDSGLEIAPYSSVTLTSAASTFGGGVRVDSGDIDVPTTLVIGASSTNAHGEVANGPLGVETLSLGDNTALNTVDSNPYEIDNDIVLTGAGTVYLLDGSLGAYLTLGGKISGNAGIEIPVSNGSVGNNLVLTSPTSTFIGGVTVDDYPGYPNSTLAIGASSTSGPSGSVTMGPLGTGTLRLDPDSTLTVIGLSPYVIGNNIHLNNDFASDNTVTLLGSGNGGNLTLSGVITGDYDNAILIPAVTNDGPGNSVTLTSGSSTFGGGVTVGAAQGDGTTSTLVIGASSSGGPGNVTSGPLGTGTLTLDASATFTTNSNTTPYSIGNAINLNYGAHDTYLDVTLMGTGGNLTLTGSITGNAMLDIPAASDDVGNTVTLTSMFSTFSAGLTLDAAGSGQSSSNLIIGASSSGGSDARVTMGPLGTGTLTLGAGSSFTTNSITTPYSIGNSIDLNGSGRGPSDNVVLMGTGGNLTLTGTIDGNVLLEIPAGSSGANTVTLASAGSTFSAGLMVDAARAGEFSSTLVVGASSSGGSDASVTMGPLGTGTLTLDAGSTLGTESSSTPYTIGNSIDLSRESGDIGDSVILLGAGLGGNLTLTGIISGNAGLEIAAGEVGANTVTLDSLISMFSGGVTVDGTNEVANHTTLVVGMNGSGLPGSPAWGPLGTGTLTLGYDANLTTPPSTPITILNNIRLGNGTLSATSVTLGGVSRGELTLEGSIADFGGPGSLVINGPVDLEGNNTYTGGTTINGTVVTIGTNTGLGFGRVTANASTLNFTSSSPSLYNPTFVASTVNFNDVSPALTRLLLQSASTINFQAGSTPSIVDMASDAPYSRNVINLGNGANTALTIQVDGADQYNGSIAGNGSVTVTTGSEFGAFYLGAFEIGSNSYSGGTTVDANTLLVAGNNFALGSGPVTINPGAAFGAGPGVTITNQITIPNDGAGIGGFGTLSPSTAQNIVIQNGSGVTGGMGSVGHGGSGPSNPVVGVLSFGSGVSSLVFGTGGILQFSIMNAAGTPGVDFSQIEVAGNLSFTATPGNDFIIQLVGVDSAGNGIGTANSFNPSQSYSWMLLSAGSISNFNSADFLVDSTTYFLNSTGTGQFFVTDSGNDLFLNFTPVPEPSSCALMASGLCALAITARRRRR